MSEIKEKIDHELSVTSLFSRRSDNTEREVSDNTIKIKAPRSPTCCYMGCFEPRVPPRSYCFDHEEFEMNE